MFHCIFNQVADGALKECAVERCNDRLALRARSAEERAVALVQRAHRRDEADVAGEMQVAALADDPHVAASASVAPASVS